MVVNYIYFALCLVGIIVGLWGILKKLGDYPWKSLIPFYQFYPVIKKVYRPSAFWIMLSFFILAALTGSLVAGLGGGEAMNYSALNAITDVSSAIAFLALMSVLSIIYTAAIIVLIVFLIKFLNNLSKAFGHSGWYTLGVIFLPFIFLVILGFNRDKYLGNVFADKSLFVRSNYGFKQAIEGIKLWPTYIKSLFSKSSGGKKNSEKKVTAGKQVTSAKKGSAAKQTTPAMNAGKEKQAPASKRSAATKSHDSKTKKAAVKKSPSKKATNTKSSTAKTASTTKKAITTKKTSTTKNKSTNKTATSKQQKTRVYSKKTKKKPSMRKTK